MQFDAFLSDLADVLEVDRAALTDDFALDNTNWDSMNIVSTIALIDEHFRTTLPAEAFGSCSSIGDLLALIKAKLAN